MSKEQMLEQIGSRVDQAQVLMVECIELIYKGAFNEAIEKAAKAADDEGDYNPASYYVEAIEKLKL